MVPTSWCSLSLAATAAVLAAGCGGPKGSKAPAARPLEMTEAGLAAITIATRADAATLGALVPGAEVRPDPESPDVLDVWQGGEKLFYVVLVSAAHPEKGPFNVQATSPRIAGPGGWRVGATVASAGKLDACECWTDLRVCYQKGTYVAVGFASTEEDCQDQGGVDGVAGLTISRLVWNPKAWPDDRNDEVDPDEGAPYEGEPYEGDPCEGDPCEDEP